MQTIIAILAGIFVYALTLSLVSKKTIHKDMVQRRIQIIEKTNLHFHDEENELSKPLSERVLKPLINKFVQAVSRIIPATNSANSSVTKRKKMLEQAGLSMTVDDYNALQLLVMLGGGILGLLLGLSMNFETLQLLVYVLVGIYAGFAILRFIVTSRGTARKQLIERQLPDMLDLLSVSVEAGLGFEQALYQITQNMEGPLIDEIAVTYREMAMGRPRREALILLGERCDIDDVRAFTGALVQAGQLGISIKNVLQSQAISLRRSKRNKIQEQAAKLSTKILFPMLIFIFPVLFIVLLGPSLTNILEYL